MAITANRTWVTGEFPTAAYFNAFSDNLRAWKGLPWIIPILDGHWTSGGPGAGGTVVSYTLIGKQVQMRGDALTAGPSGSPVLPANIFTLLPAYRPAEQQIFTSIANAALGRIDVQTDGQVIANFGTLGAAFQLDAIHYLVA